MPIIKYFHHGRYVSVMSKSMGDHRAHCLCFYPCRHFIPADRDNNCPVAERVFALDKDFGLVTPVWECPRFSE